MRMTRLENLDDFLLDLPRPSALCLLLPKFNRFLLGFEVQSV